MRRSLPDVPLRGSLTAELPGDLDPNEALACLAGAPGRILLRSAGTRGRFTYLVAAPRAILVSDSGGTRLLEDGWAEAPFAADPFTGLEKLLARFRSSPSEYAAPFAGGIVGYLSFECGRYLERLPPSPPDDLGMPEAWFGVYDCVAVWDRESGRCFAHGIDTGDGELKDRLEALCARLRESRQDVPGTRVRPTPPYADGLSSDDIVSSLSRSEFMYGVETLRRYVRAGDLFQANLTRRMEVRSPISGEELYRRLLIESPAEFSAYLDTGHGEVASISPELFLSVRGAEVRTHPIKGTAPRGRDASEDSALRRALEGSAKDRAENVMIVDLLRNDLSRVCRPGSIRVPRLAELETHPTVHHLVSSVTGTLEANIGPVDLLRATFPGGSITGAPKIRSMEVIAELEPVRRGVYTGALGFIGFDGSMDLSVAIRTAVLREGRACYGTGAGITLASDAAAEWQETEDKALAFLRALRANVMV